MRVTTAFNRLLKLDGANVTDVEIGADAAASGRIRLQCGRDSRPYRPATKCVKVSDHVGQGLCVPGVWRGLAVGS